MDIHVRVGFILKDGRRIPIACPSWLKAREVCNAGRSNGTWVFRSLKLFLKAPCVPLLQMLKYKYILHGIKKTLLLPAFSLSHFSVSRALFFKQDAERTVARSSV